MSAQRTLFYNYDPSGTTLNYGKFLETVNVRGFIKTSGSSTTTTAVESSGDGALPFDQAEVGDWLQVQDDSAGLNTTFFRRITAKASSTSVTVDTAWNLGTGKAAKLLGFRVGTAADSGQVFSGTNKHSTVKINVAAVGSGSVTVSIEGKMSETDITWTEIFTQAYTTVTSDVFSIVEPWSWLRVGLKETAGAGVDSVSVYLVFDDNLFV